jgi:thiol:disulfide interchange protein DsbD
MRLLLTLFLAVSPLLHAAEPELLEPEKAFQFAARLQDANSIEVSYRVAPGYYLYRDKFHFSAAPAQVTLGAARIPPGKRTRDEFFGEVETHRGDVRIVVPFEVEGAGVPSLTLTAISQGCADVGVCYTPQEQKAELMLASFTPAAPAEAAQRRSASARSRRRATRRSRRSSPAVSGSSSWASSASDCCSRSRPACCRWCRSSRASSSAGERT